MNKRRIGLIILVVAAGLILFKQCKGDVASWYVDNYVRHPTAFPSSERPDLVCLTWCDDPCTTQAIQWRTAPVVAEGWVQYRAKDSTSEPPAEVQAQRAVLEDPLVDNDPVNHRFTAVLHGLLPSTAYAYRVGSNQPEAWSEWAEFETAPANPEAFSFIYLGDAQIGMDYWGKLLQQAYEHQPEAAFCIIAGDLVNNGSYRNEWDAFFAAAVGLFDRRPLVPAPGNHDYDGQAEPQLYLDLFGLPENGPQGITPEKTYAFHYGNAHFIVLDSNVSAKKQTSWLESQLAGSKAVWKIAVYHHPAYASKEHRDNQELREQWGAIFDQYHVDLALQGHDHAYLRTPPMKGGRAVDSPREGTIYVVSVSGTKYYPQVEHDYAAVAMTNTSTYQTIDIALNPDRLTYRAMDDKGAVRDEVVIEK